MNTEKKMFCPACQELNITSCVYEVQQPITIQPYIQYAAMWDEDGSYHNHNPNDSGVSYRCSRGHAWQPPRTCSNCDWVGGYSWNSWDRRMVDANEKMAA